MYEVAPTYAPDGDFMDIIHTYIPSPIDWHDKARELVLAIEFCGAIFRHESGRLVIKNWLRSVPICLHKAYINGHCSTTTWWDGWVSRRSGVRPDRQEKLLALYEVNSESANEGSQSGDSEGDYDDGGGELSEPIEEDL